VFPTPQGPPPTIQVDPSQHPDNTQGSSDPIGSLRDAMGSLADAEQAEPDDIFSHQIADLRAKVAKLIADHQKQQDDLMQGKSSPQALRRSGSY
jgi:hypothetical protein